MAMTYLEKLCLTWLLISQHLTIGAGGESHSPVYIQGGDVYLSGLHVIHEHNGSGFCSPSIRRLEGFQLFLGAVHAIEKVNKNPDILPGIKLGMIHFDTCHMDVIAAERTLRIILYRISGQKDEVNTPQQEENGHAKNQGVVDPTAGEVMENRAEIIGVVGPIYSSQAILVSNILQLYDIAVVSATASSDDLSDRDKYPNFFRTTSPTSYQARVMGAVIEYFRWTYISIVYDEGPYGFSGLKNVRAACYKLGVCIANSHALVENFQNEDYDEIIVKLRADYKARVVVLFSTSQHMKSLFQACQRMSAQGEFLFLLSKNGSPQTFQGVEDVVEDSLILGMPSVYDPDFEDFVNNVSPSTNSQIPYLSEIWKQHLRCDIMNTTCSEKKMKDIEGFKYYRNSIMSSYAVNAFADAMNTLQAAECPGRESNHSVIKNCITNKKLLTYITNATVEVKDAHDLKFNSEGFYEEQLIVLQLQSDNKGSIELIPVGKLGGQSNSITMSDKLKWTKKKFMMDLTRNHYSSVVPNMTDSYSRGGNPESVCAKPCGQGEFYLKGTVSCCWDCKKCRDNEVVNKNGTSCKICDPLTWPNGTYSGCLPISPAFLTWGSWYSIALLVLAGAGMILTFYIWYIVLRYRSRRVIKGANWTMLMVILIGLDLAFGSVVFFVAMPTYLICVCGGVGFSLSCTFIFAPVLVKTNGVYQVFESAAKLSRSVQLAAPNFQRILVTFILAIQISIVLACHIVWPISAKRTMPIPTVPYVELACDQDLVGLLLPLSYNILLLLICTVLGFLTRKLPDNFNESWYIFICVSGTLFVWIAFMPTYFSAFYAYHKATLLAFALILNGYVTILCFFAPKIYALKYVAEKDIKISFMTGSSPSKSYVTSMSNLSVPASTSAAVPEGK